MHQFMQFLVSASICVENVFLRERENTKFRHQVMIQNTMGHNTVRLSYKKIKDQRSNVKATPMRGWV